MILNLRPQFCGGASAVSKAGDVLTVDGESYDFSTIPEGGSIPAFVVPCPWIVEPVTRTGGHIVLTLTIPCGYSPTTIPRPAPLVDPSDGPISLPVLPAPAEGGADGVDA